MSEATIGYAEEARIRDLLLGRRIVAAEQGDFPTGDDWHTSAEGRLTLDDGTRVFVVPNEGCGGCSAGWYQLAHLAAVDNIITNVRLDTDQTVDRYGDGPTTYRIFVVADAVEVNLLTIEGDDGNGYYGSGYELIVRGAA